MRTNPFVESFAFLTGTSTFHNEAGWQGILMVPLFYGLLGASIWIAHRAWTLYPEQRTAEHLGMWFIRVMVGIMWFEGSIWKLPLPISGGFSYWVDQIAIHAAFGFHQWIATNVFKPMLFLLNPLVFLTEVGMAACLMLGFSVRLVAVVGIAFTLHLYIGLFRHPGEWPWTYIFIALLNGYFLVTAAGRSLGLDALFRNGKTGPAAPNSPVREFYALAS